MSHEKTATGPHSSPRSPRSFIALFAYGHVLPATVDSLLRDLPLIPSAVYHRESSDALISRTRSFTATEFLRGDCDILVMIDHDIAWQSGDLLHLIDKVMETRAIVGGVYPKRRFGMGLASRFAGPGEYTIGSDRLVPAQYVSAGFFGAHREVVQAVADEMPLTTEGFWPLFMPMLSPPRQPSGAPEYLSEDWAFCERARQQGAKLYLDLRPRLTHTGTHRYRVVDSHATLPRDEPVTIRVTRSTPT